MFMEIITLHSAKIEHKRPKKTRNPRIITGRNDTTQNEMTRKIRDEESVRGGAGDIC